MYVPQHTLDIVQLSGGQQCKISLVAAAISHHVYVCCTKMTPLCSRKDFWWSDWL